jgi:hypothetical protein
MADAQESTNQLLRVIIALLMKDADSLKKLRQQVEFLDQAGLKPSEIAKIIGRTNTYVSKELTGIRKTRK